MTSHAFLQNPGKPEFQELTVWITEVYMLPISLTSGSLHRFLPGFKAFLPTVFQLKAKFLEGNAMEERVREFTEVIDGFHERPPLPVPFNMWMIPRADDLLKLPGIWRTLHEQNSTVKATAERVRFMFRSDENLKEYTELLRSRRMPLINHFCTILCEVLRIPMDNANKMPPPAHILSHPAAVFRCSCFATPLMSFAAVLSHIFAVHRDLEWKHYRALVAKDECRTALDILEFVKTQIPIGRCLTAGTLFSCSCDFRDPFQGHFVALVSTLVSPS